MNRLALSPHLDTITLVFGLASAGDFTDLISQVIQLAAWITPVQNNLLVVFRHGLL
jgi:hypothetical protein